MKNKYINVVEKFAILKNYSFSRENESEYITKYRHVHYGDIHTKFNIQIGNETYVPFLNENVKISVNDNIKKGDVIMVDASEDYKDLGKSIYIEHTPKVLTVAGLHTFHLHPSYDYYGLYFKYFTESQNFKRQMARVGTGLSVFGISKSNLEKVLIPDVSYDDQFKHGKLLSSMDKLIELEKNLLKNCNNETFAMRNELIENLKQQKKYYLNQIFK